MEDHASDPAMLQRRCRKSRFGLDCARPYGGGSLSGIVVRRKLCILLRRAGSPSPARLPLYGTRRGPRSRRLPAPDAAYLVHARADQPTESAAQRRRYHVARLPGGGRAGHQCRLPGPRDPALDSDASRPLHGGRCPRLHPDDPASLARRHRLRVRHRRRCRRSIPRERSGCIWARTRAATPSDTGWRRRPADAASPAGPCDCVSRWAFERLDIERLALWTLPGNVPLRPSPRATASASRAWPATGQRTATTTSSTRSCSP